MTKRRKRTMSDEGRVAGGEGRDSEPSSPVPRPSPLSARIKLLEMRVAGLEEDLAELRPNCPCAEHKLEQYRKAREELALERLALMEE